MLAEAELPKRFWTEAINTACYTQDMSMINKAHDKTSYKIWKEMKPNISYFYVFGSKCFIHNNEKNHLKAFDSKLDEEIFLGYVGVNKAFIVFNKKTLVVEEIPYI